MTKPLCKIKKLLKKDIAAYASHVRKPEFICEKCGRAAKDGKLLCEPIRIKDLTRKKPK